MPYDANDMKGLPEPVQKIPEAARGQWVAVFNSAYKDCTDNGGKDCEASAMGQAWGVVNKRDDMQTQTQAAETPPPAPAETTPAEPPAAEPVAEPATEEQPVAGPVKITLKDLLSAFENMLKGLFGGTADTNPKDVAVQGETTRYAKTHVSRALSLMTIIDKVSSQISEEDPLAGVLDFYFDEKSGLSSIVTSQGKMFAVPISINGNTVTTGTWKELAIQQSRAPSFTITRSLNDQYRWLSISATTVLNRDGEIDSRKLFDSFIAHAEKTGLYPERVFYHAGTRFRTGQCDFLARDDNCLITSGLYDQTELAMREVIARSTYPTDWGDSISFDPLEPPLELRANGTTIPVYTAGVLREISTLPENEAAGWFTSKTTLMEVKRMLNDRQMQAFIKFFEGDEKRAKEWLEENSASRNRNILDAGMVTRAKKDLAVLRDAAVNLVVQAPAPAPVETSQPEPAPVALTPAVTEPVAPQTDPLDVIVERLATKLDLPGTISRAMEPVQTQLTALETRLRTVEGVASKFQQAETALNTETAQLEVIEQKKRQWFADLPASAPVFRPSINRGTQKPGSSEDAAKTVLDSIPAPKY